MFFRFQTFIVLRCSAVKAPKLIIRDAGIDINFGLVEHIERATDFPKFNQQWNRPSKNCSARPLPILPACMTQGFPG